MFWRNPQTTRTPKPIVDRVSKPGFCDSVSVLIAIGLIVGGALTQSGSAQSSGDPNLRRHWAPAFDVVLPKGVSSDDLKGRCWKQPALNSYVTEGRLWIEDIYGLPYGYVENHCLREQLSKTNAALDASYGTLLRSLDPAERKRLVASERRWIVRRNDACNVSDGISYVMLGSFVCLMNMTSDRLAWLATWKADRPAR
ncbi:lysozyme inhibitor LprI family protein [Sphingomonas faeni]|uniref:lysozyme inhibitor LprI family protein n=1 Tax=Sphingomonas faeni TaxID=185950 RepID=UPI00335F3DD9